MTNSNLTYQYEKDQGIQNPGLTGNDVEPEHGAQTEDLFDVSIMTEAEIKDEKRNIIKNILLISLAFLFIFNAFQGLSRLQSSLHRQEGMGTACSAILYTALMLSSLFLPKVMIHYIGYKWTIAFSFIGYILWMAANGYAVWGTMVTGSILLGTCGAPLWAAQKSYFTIVAIRYAKLTKQDADAMVARFIGIFFCFFQFSGVTGSIISSTVLRQPPNEIDDEVLQTCGANDCPGNNASNPNTENPEEKTVWIMLGIYIGIAIFGVILVAGFVNDLPQHVLPKRENKLKEETIELLSATVKLVKQPKMIALIPLMVYTGFEQGAFTAEFTKSFVTCAMGIWQVGFVTIPYGLMNALSSLVCGRLAQYTGRIVLITAGFLVDYTIQIVLITWMPKQNQDFVVYILATMWGFTDAMWQTLLNAMLGVIFPDPVPAFNNDSLWGSFGFVIAFAYSQYLCTDVKLYILISVLSVSVLGYYVAEYLHKREVTSEFMSKNVPIKNTTDTLGNENIFAISNNNISTEL